MFCGENKEEKNNPTAPIESLIAAPTLGHPAEQHQ